MHCYEPRGYTMAMSMEDFLLRYFRQLHFDKMPEAQKSQFDAYVAKNDFRGDMKSWRDDLLKKDATGNLLKNSDGHYVHNDLPDGVHGDTKMEDNDWDDLYLGLYNTFVAIDADRKNLSRTDDGKKLLNFVDKYFGEDESFTFSLQRLDSDIKDKIDDLLVIFKNDPALYSSVGVNSLDERKNLEGLIGKKDKLDKPANRALIYNLVSNLQSKLEYDSEFQASVGKNKTFNNFDLGNLRTIQEELYKEKIVTPRDRVKLQRAIGDILNTLHDNSKIYNIFKTKDKSKISEALDDAIGKTDYTGKITEKDYVKPKYEDTLDWREKLQKKTKDLYDDTIKKYMTAHRDHIYVKDTAKTIGGVLVGMAADPKNGINLNESGLDAIIQKESDILNALQDKSPLASKDHFDWFIKQLKLFQKNGKAKDVAGALRDGDKMNHLVEDMAINAIDEGSKDAIEKVKTAMEVLKVIQQPFFGGHLMDVLHQKDFKEAKLFSDPSLSFNKSNPAIQSITNALDATLRFATRGIVLAGTGAASLYNRRHLGFNKSSKLEKGHQEREKEKHLAYETIENNNREDGNKITDLYYEQQKTGIKDGEDLADKEKRLENAKNKLKKLEKKQADVIKRLNQYESIIADFDKHNELEAKHGEVGKELAALTKKLKEMKGTSKDAFEEMLRTETQQDHKAKIEDSNKIWKDLDNIDKKYGSFEELTNQVNYLMMGGENNAVNTAKALKEKLDYAHAKQKRAIEKLEQRISAYKTADAEMMYYEKEIKNRNDEFAKWDDNHHNYYYELMGFWNFLQTGHTKNLLKLSTKRLQDKMDQGEMNQIYTRWMKDHSYAI